MLSRSLLRLGYAFASRVPRSIDRGTPLAEVLRAQAADVREAGKRRLLEAGSRKEIAMMVPVVSAVDGYCSAVGNEAAVEPVQR